MLRSYSKCIFILLIIAMLPVFIYCDNSEDNHFQEIQKKFISNIKKQMTDIDSLKLYLDTIEDSIRLNQIIVNDQFLWHFHYFRAYNYGKLGDSDNAFIHFDKAFELARLAENINLQVQTQLSAGNLYYKLGYNRMAAKRYEFALAKAIQIDDKEIQFKAHQNLGIVYKVLEKYDNSLTNFNWAKNIRIEQGRENELGLLYNNIGTLYNEIDDNDQALKSYLKAEELLKIADDQNSLALLYNNLGNLYLEKDDDKLAEKYYMKSLELKEKNSKSYMVTLGNLGLLYLGIDDDKAFSYIESAIQICTENKYLYQLSIIYESLAEYYEESDEYSKAEEYLKLMHDVKKKIFDDEKNAQIKDIEKFYDLESKAEKLTALQYQNSIEKVRLRLNRLYMIIPLVVIALCVTGIIILYKRIKKHNYEIHILSIKTKELEEKREKKRIVLEMMQKLQIQLKERIDSEIEHIRNKDSMIMVQSRNSAMGEMIGNIAHQWRQPINAIGIIIQNFADAFEFDELTEDYFNKKTNTIYELISYMEQTIDDFKNFFRPAKENETFDVGKVLNRAVEFVSCTFQARNIDYQLDVQDGIFMNGISNEFFQVIINIMNNAKDAFQIRQTPNPNIKIELGKYSKENGYIVIQDNAGGIEDDIIDEIFDPYITSKESIKGTGMGLYIAKHIVNMRLNGEISVENKNDGAAFIIKFPIHISD